MPDVSLVTPDGNTKKVSTSSLESSFEGELIAPGSPRYDEARAIWNAMIDRRPGLIARCKSAADVERAVQFARTNGALVAVRGAGHNIAGNAVCDGGLVIDLSQMRSVKVDAKARTARVAPGATLGDIDAATQAHGLALPIGINSTTGISGLTLGGGLGWLSRKHGLTIDNLISADVVTAAGKTVKASATENPDLFWAIRGGGGNYGVVTSFEFKLHPVGPEVLAGLIVHPYDDPVSLFKQYREVVSKAPDELTVWVVLRKAPPLPFLPAEVHGTSVFVLAAVYSGDIKEGEKAMAPLRKIGKPIADVIGPHKFAEFQQAFDPLLTPGLRNYWKSHDFTDLSDGLIETMAEQARHLPTDHCEIFIGNLGAAVSRVPANATAYTHRDVRFIMNVHTRWESPSQDKTCIAWARKLFDDTAKYATGGVYVNFMPNDEQERVAAAYGVNYERLVALKKKYDPDNLFRLNQNIHPTATARA